MPTGRPDAPAPAHRYLAVYDLDPGADAAAVLAELGRRFGGPDMAASDALDQRTLAMSVSRPRA